MDMSKLLAATLAGALALSACAPAHRMSAPAPSAIAPVADLSGGPALVSSRHFDDGYRMYRKGQFLQATNAFERALEENPGDYTAAYMMGMSYLNRGRNTDAQDAFRQALERGPDRITASQIYSAMGYSYEADHATRMAHHQYHLACKMNKSNPYAQAGSARTEFRDLTKTEIK
jgi:Tfp pilus assembly protein PilF